MLLKRLHIQKRKGLKPILLTSLLAAAASVSLCAPAMAQNSESAKLGSDGFRLNVETPYTDNRSLLGLNTSDIESTIELPIESVGSQLFNLDVSNSSCITGERTCLTHDERLDMRYSKSLTASIDSFLDIELTPRASMRFNDDSSSALVGALVRIGDDLKDGEELKSNTWYMFAGADAEAVSYSPDSLSSLTRGNVHLQDRIIVGDAQAGVGYRIGESTDISLGYFRREVTSFGRENDMDNISFSEDAAAISFTWRR